MDKLIQKFRTPIISFCIGVLFSVVFFWIYLELNSNKESKEIIIHKSEDQKEEDTNASYISQIKIFGLQEDSISCEVDLSKDVINQLNSCVELDDKTKSLVENADLLSISDNSFWIFISQSLNPSEVLGSSSETEVEIMPSSVCININTASQSELETLPGIGATYASRIIEGRPYVNKADIKNVKGIGDKTYGKIESLICL